MFNMPNTPPKSLYIFRRGTIYLPASAEEIARLRPDNGKNPTSAPEKNLPVFDRPLRSCPPPLVLSKFMEIRQIMYDPQTK